MGKKKSVALIIVISVVLAALIFMSVASFPVPSTVKNYNSLLSIIDLGTDLGGGYSTVYYPDGVISQENYNDLMAAYEAGEATEDPKDDVDNPEEQYIRHKGVYLSESIYSEEDGTVTNSFKSEFDSAFAALQNRFEHKGFAEYSIKLQDDFTIRVEIPRTEEDAGTLFDSFAYGGSLLFTDDAGNEMEGTAQNIKSADVVDAGDSGYAVAINFTKEGRAAFSEMTGAMVSSAGSSGSATMYIRIGSQNLVSNGISVSSQMDQASIYISGSYTTRGSAETVAAIINSALQEDMVFNLKLVASDTSIIEPAMGEYAALVIAILFGVLILTAIVFSAVRYKGMGLANIYGVLTYAVAFVLCLALIPVIRLDIAGVMAIALSSVIVIGFNLFAFENIRKRAEQGGTMAAAIRKGYNNDSLAFTIEAHIVLFIMSLAITLISTGTVYYMSLIFLIGTLLSAACSLAVTRFYLYMFMALPKKRENMTLEDSKKAFCNIAVTGEEVAEEGGRVDE